MKAKLLYNVKNFSIKCDIITKLIETSCYIKEVIVERNNYQRQTARSRAS